MQGIEEILAEVDRRVVVSDVEVTRTSLVSLLLEKHHRRVEDIRKELEELKGRVVEIKRSAEEERQKRDTINERVKELKRMRGELKEENRRLRSEFFQLIELERKSESPSREVKLYKKYIEDLEWKLQTEAITLETEKRILREMREAYSKLRELTQPERVEEINQKIMEITKKIGENMARIEELHNEMSSLVEESNKYHQSYIAKQREYRDVESRLKWLEHLLKREEESITFWRENENRMVMEDEVDQKRPIWEIVEILEGYYSAREEKRSAEEEEEMELKKRAFEGGTGEDGNVSGSEMEGARDTSNAGGEIEKESDGRKGSEKAEDGGEGGGKK